MEDSDARQRAKALGPQAEEMVRALAEMPAPVTGHEPGDGTGHGGGGEHPATVREMDHAGHRIVVRTWYEVTVDGQPLDVHLEVNDDGLVHGHGLPNYAVPSALELIARLIDASRGGEGTDEVPDEIAHVYEDRD